MPHKKQSLSLHCEGFSLYEILISIMIFTLGILAVTKMQLLAIQNDETAYQYSLAENQLQAMVERFYLGTHPTSMELQVWNRENALLLPNGMGEIKGRSPYILTVTWAARKVKTNHKIAMIVPYGF